jgi:tetratricopeptide (TPR) repeat protein
VGDTAPLKTTQVRQLEAPKEDDLEGMMDPVTQARQLALTLLAGMLFEGADEENTVPRGDLGDLMRGRGKGARRQDRTRISLHLSQVVDAQTHEQNNQAMVELERALDAGLDHPAAYFDLGYLYFDASRYEPAHRNLQLALASPELALGARLLMGVVLTNMDRIGEASIEYLQALKIADSLVVSEDQADLLRQLYEPMIENARQQTDEEYQRHLCENIRELLTRPDWRAHLKRARAQLGDQDVEAPPMPLAEILTEARSSQVVDSLANIYRLARDGHIQSAMEEAFYALQYAPTYLPLHTYMGELLRRQGLLQDATAKLLVVARTFTIRGEPNRAIEIYRKIIEYTPMDLVARAKLIEHLIAQNNYEAAVQEYYETADVYYNLADLDMARKTYTEALRLVQQARLNGSFRVQILHRMADIDLQSLDWRQALRIYEQIRTQDPSDEKARYSLIELNYRLGQEQVALSELDNYLGYLVSNNLRDEALAFLKGMVSENPERLAVRRRLAELYRQMGRRKEAIEELDAIGEALLETGDRNGAIKVIERILTMNPTNSNDYEVLLETLKER